MIPRDATAERIASTIRSTFSPLNRDDSLAGGALGCASAVFRAYAMYEPLRVFTIAAVVLAVAALGAWTPFLVDWIFNGDSSGHIQSLILGAVLALAAVQLFGLGVVGDALAGQRVMTQRVFERVRRIELSLGIEPSHYEGETKPSEKIGA